MSYNITNTKVKELDNFCIPLTELLKVSSDNELDNVQTVLTDFKQDDEIDFFIGSEQSVFGVVENDYLVVTDIDLSGDSSDGYLYEDWLPMFGKTTGHMKLKITWDGGDASNKLTVTDGKVKLK